MTLTIRSDDDTEGYVEAMLRSRVALARSKYGADRPELSDDEYLASNYVAVEAMRLKDVPSRLVLDHDGQIMVAVAHGPTNAAWALRQAVARLEGGAGSYHQHIDDQTYGLHLRFARNGDLVRIERIREMLKLGVMLDTDVEELRPGTSVSLAGPSRLDVEWYDFVDAVDAYKRWHLTEYLERAPWLRLAPIVQEWLTEHRA